MKKFALSIFGCSLLVFVFGCAAFAEKRWDIIGINLDTPSQEALDIVKKNIDKNAKIIMHDVEDFTGGEKTIYKCGFGVEDNKSSPREEFVIPFSLKDSSQIIAIYRNVSFSTSVSGPRIAELRNMLIEKYGKPTIETSKDKILFLAWGDDIEDGELQSRIKDFYGVKMFVNNLTVGSVYSKDPNANKSATIPEKAQRSLVIRIDPALQREDYVGSYAYMAIDFKRIIESIIANSTIKERLKSKQAEKLNQNKVIPKL